MLDLIDW